MSVADLEAALATSRPSVIAYLTAGFPDRSRFLAALDALETVADAIEIGVPFSDPMADGPTIQRSSHVALAAGATLDGTLADLEARAPRQPRLLMSYLCPLLALPHDTLAPRLARAGVSAVVVPDLPHEESGALASALAAHDVALVPMVTPLTPSERLARTTADARGLVYAVTRTGTTGGGLSGAAGSATDRSAIARYLERVRAVTRAPVIAGFGVRTRADVAALSPPAHGVVVGSALVEIVERGESVADFVRSLR